MTSLIDSVAEYLGSKLDLIAGTDLHTINFPSGDEIISPSICIQEPIQIDETPSQINASEHYVRIVACADTNTTALDTAASCYRWLLTDDENYKIEDYDILDTPGILTLNNGLVVQCQLLGFPIWLKSDDKNRQYFGFASRIVCKRLI